MIHSSRGHGSTRPEAQPDEHDSTVSPGHPASTQPAAPHASETVLIVDDDDGVRLLTRLVLDRAGYHVLEAGGPRQGLQVATDFSGPIHLIVSDVMMPDSEGPLLADRLRSTRPEVRVLYMSGFPGGAAAEHGEVPEGCAFLAKPFTPLALLQKVREVLAAPPHGGGSGSAPA